MKKKLRKLRLREDEGYHVTMNEYLSAKPASLRKAGKYPTREELHDRRGH